MCLAATRGSTSKLETIIYPYKSFYSKKDLKATVRPFCILFLVFLILASNKNWLNIYSSTPDFTQCMLLGLHCQHRVNYQLFFETRGLLCWTHDPPASAPNMLRLQVWATMPDIYLLYVTFQKMCWLLPIRVICSCSLLSLQMWLDIYSYHFTVFKFYFLSKHIK